MKVESEKDLPLDKYVKVTHPDIKYPLYVEKRLEKYWELFEVTITGWKSAADFRRFEIKCPLCPVEPKKT